MKQKTKDPKKNNIPFYSSRGIWLMAAFLLLFVILALTGMYTLGIIHLPDAFLAIFGQNADTDASAVAVNIAPETESDALYEAIPREEYAKALADMQLPDAYYRAYSITLSFGIRKDVTDYIAIRRGDDFWVQTSKEDIILHTAVCKDGNVRITDNAQNTSVTAKGYSAEHPEGVSFAERCGVLTLDQLLEMIRAIANGEKLDYGGGIVDYSLSYTQARGTGENVFVFTFTCKNGVTEEYRFAFESAVILSAKKSFGEVQIYKMEMKEHRNDLSDVDVDSLLTLE
ncbi:MAG: hypothetical protein IIU58_00350 [Clostridia bacterium]|nr:hypothetical protein [Clostridia bacterium]